MEKTVYKYLCYKLYIKFICIKKIGFRCSHIALNMTYQKMVFWDSSHPYTNNLFIPTARTSHYGLILIKVQGPKIWNEIPPTIRNSIASNIKYKQILLQSYNIH